MDDQRPEIIGNFGLPTTTSENIDNSQGAVNSFGDETLGIDEQSDAISSGSSFEILSVKEESEGTQEVTDESEVVTSILGGSGDENKDSDGSYRVERTKQYVMESEFDFADDGDSDSDHFVKIDRANVKCEAVITVNEDQTFTEGQTVSEAQVIDDGQPVSEDQYIDEGQPINEDRCIDEGQVFREGQLTNEDQCINEGQLETDSADFIELLPSTSDLSVEFNGEVAELHRAPDDKETECAIGQISERSGAVDSGLAEPELLIGPDDNNGTHGEVEDEGVINNYLHQFFTFSRIFLVIAILVAAIIFRRNLEKQTVVSQKCTYGDIADHFEQKSSCPDCLKHSSDAEEIYKMAVDVHSAKMVQILNEFSGVSHRYAELAQEYQILKDLSAETSGRVSELLAINKDLELRVGELMQQLWHKFEESSSSEEASTDESHQHTDTSYPKRKLNSQDGLTADPFNLTDGFLRLVSAIEDFHANVPQKQMTGNLGSELPIFISFVKHFVETSVSASDKNLPDQIKIFESSFRSIGRCIDLLQNLIPSQTIYDIISIDWLQARKIMSLKTAQNDKEIEEEVMMEPCHMFMPPKTPNTLTGKDSVYGKDFQGYVNKTLDAVDRIGRSVRSTLESIKTFPNKFFGDNTKLFNSFGQKFKDSVESMNKRFNKGYNKLKEKLNRKFKGSLGEFSKKLRAGWDKINKKVNSAESWFSRTKSRFRNRVGKMSELKKESSSDVNMENTKMVKDEHNVRMMPDQNDEELRYLQMEKGNNNEEASTKRLNKIGKDHFVKEIESVKGKYKAGLVKLHSDIFKLSSAEFEALDCSDRLEYWNKLSAIDVDDMDASNWIKKWLNCQTRWWSAVSFHNSIPQNLFVFCKPWLAKWQFEVQDGIFTRECASSKSVKLSLSTSSAEKNFDRYCMRGDCSNYKQFKEEQKRTTHKEGNLHKKKQTCDEDNHKNYEPDDSVDARWYFKQSGDHESLIPDPSWYFEMMEDRESGRHDPDWYFGKKHDFFSDFKAPQSKRDRNSYRGR